MYITSQPPVYLKQAFCCIVFHHSVKTDSFILQLRILIIQT